MTIRYEGRSIRKPEVIARDSDTFFLLPSKEQDHSKDLVIRTVPQPGKKPVGVLVEGQEINRDPLLAEAGITWTNKCADPVLVFLRRQRR